jgi:hypothetical protein
MFDEQSVNIRLASMYYYKRKKLNHTDKDLDYADSISKQLLEKNYTLEQIYDVIDYNIKNPPAKGFKSYAWLLYCMEECLNKIKIEKIKEDQRYVLPKEATIIESNKTISPGDRVSFDLDIGGD